MSLFHRVTIDQRNRFNDTVQGTKVYVDDMELKGVTSITATCEVDSFPCVTITLKCNDIEMIPYHEVDDETN